MSTASIGRPSLIEILPHRGDTPPNEGPFPFERRATPRIPVEGWALAAFTDPQGGVSLTRVDMVDVSGGGIAFDSPMPVPVGAEVWLYPEGRRTDARVGCVVRCKPDTSNYRVAFTWEHRAAA